MWQIKMLYRQSAVNGGNSLAWMCGSCVERGDYCRRRQGYY